MDRTNLTDDQITDCITYWRIRLDLSDWGISFVVTNQSNIPEKYADVEWNLCRKTAMIRIADPDTWSSADAGDEDMETSIVHELYHLTTAPLLSTINNRVTLSKVETEICIEQPAEVLSYLLVALRRQAGHKFDWERKKKR